MVVTALVGLVVAASSTMIFQADAARRRAERDTDALAEAHAAIQTIAAALVNIYRPTADDDEVVFEGYSDQVDGFPADRVRFFTVGYHNVRYEQPESDVREVEFTLTPDPDSVLPVMRRRLDPTRNLEPDGGGVVDVLARGVTMLDITYFDGVNWHDDWLLEYNALPLAVRVTVQVVEPNLYEFDQREPRRITRTRLVYLPRMPQPGQTGDQSQGAEAERAEESNNFETGGGSPQGGRP